MPTNFVRYTIIVEAYDDGSFLGTLYNEEMEDIASQSGDSMSDMLDALKQEYEKLSDRYEQTQGVSNA